jgi:Na+/H+ antiporter NhaD/arsenite permease-like protein
MIESLGLSLPIWMCIPFIGMLLSIAVFPLFKAVWWDKHKQYVVIVMSLLFLVPFTIQFGFGTAIEELLKVIVGEYLTFIVLLFGLFCVAGNICLGGNLIGRPRTNIIFLFIGTFLASLIGTTGASMVLIRPIIRANQWRSKNAHIFIFFIFLVSNIGGCLLPVGDPPLLMGYINGVDFFWSMKLLPIMLLNLALLLALFAFNDIRAYRKDLALGLAPPADETDQKLHIEGAHNIVFLVIIVIAVILGGILPQMFPVFGKGISLCEGTTLTFATMLELALILLSTFLSYKTTKHSVREHNEFTWDAIKEVAILFIGIFITMIPALLILEARGSSLGLTSPAQYFWVTGALSSFLDNTPTYLVFFATAASLGQSGGVLTTLGYIPETILMAVSCGAVFMGANTYIGNAPNFMVKSIVEENGIKMPSFFRYMLWSICYLIPVFLIDMLVFFL